MIPVIPQPEPPTFERSVRQPGQQFLRRSPHPTSEQFKKHPYWNHAVSELRRAYNEICAYCACWVPFDQGTVDHFLPKSTAPDQAYEWTNYRLAQEKLNNAKGDSTGVLDPFQIQPTWFLLDFSSMFVKPGADLRPELETAVKQTIEILQLNSNTLVRLRYTVLKDYSDGNTTIGFLERRYPFIALELKRQTLVESIRGTVR